MKKSPRLQDLEVERDRAQWGGLYQLFCKAKTEGFGEYLMTEPILFGRAFSKKPLFTWSADWGGGFGQEDVRALGYPHEDLKTYQYVPPINNLLYDGGFDYIGFLEDNYRVGPSPDYIPSWDRAPEWVGYNTGVGREFTHGTFFLSGYWVQEPKPNQWDVTSTEADSRNGSHYSSRYVFNDDPISPWLSWVDEEGGGFWIGTSAQWTNGIDTGDLQWSSWEGPYLEPRLKAKDEYVYLVNPPGNSTFVQFSGKSSQPFTLRIRLVEWLYSSFYFPNQLTEEEFFDNFNLGFVTFEDVVTFPGDWQTGEVRFPNHLRWFDRDPWELHFHGRRLLYTVFIRVEGGTPGQIVYLDDVVQSLDVTTMNVPHITVGVAEWERERDMYVGAKLWFKIGDAIPGEAPTPCEPLACTEPYTAGPNVLSSLNSQLSWSGGPDGNEIPWYLGIDTNPVSGLVWPSDASLAYEHKLGVTPFGFIQLGNESDLMIISNVSPHTGAYHLRHNSGENATGGGVRSCRFRPCDGNLFYYNRVEPGDVITIACYAKSNTGQNLNLSIEVADSDGSILDGGGDQWALTGSYTYYEFQLTAIANAFYFNGIWGVRGGGVGTITDISTLGLAIT